MASTCTHAHVHAHAHGHLYAAPPLTHRFDDVPQAENLYSLSCLDDSNDTGVDRGVDELKRIERRDDCFYRHKGLNGELYEVWGDWPTSEPALVAGEVLLMTSVVLLSVATAQVPGLSPSPQPLPPVTTRPLCPAPAPLPLPSHRLPPPPARPASRPQVHTEFGWRSFRVVGNDAAARHALNQYFVLKVRPAPAALRPPSPQQHGALGPGWPPRISLPPLPAPVLRSVVLTRPPSCAPCGCRPPSTSTAACSCPCSLRSTCSAS